MRLGIEDMCNVTASPHDALHIGIGCNITAHHENESFRRAIGFLLAIASMMATFENAIVLIVLLKYKVLHTPSNVILASLATANFLTGFIVAPLYFLEWLGIISHYLTPVTVARESLIRIFFGVSTITMAFISYDRYLHIRRLQNYKMGKKFLYTGLAVCWFAPVAISSLYLPVIHFKKFIYVEVVSTIFSLFILAAIIIPYAGILLVLRQHTTLSDNATRQMFTENQRRAGRTVAIIVTVYLLMNGPAIINEVLFVSPELNLTCAFLVMANSAVNPIIYFYQTPTLKKHALMLLGLSRLRDDGSGDGENTEIMVIVDSSTI